MGAAWERGKKLLNPSEASWKGDGFVQTGSEELRGSIAVEGWEVRQFQQSVQVSQIP